MLYFAYGSNMNPARMRRRGVPFSSRRPARLPGYRLVFNKVASTQPPGVGYANVVPDSLSQVEGALYAVEAQSLSALDACEGYPRHYRRASGPVILADGSQPHALFYVAAPHRTRRGLRPTRRYLAHLLAARDLLSPPYYEQLVKTPTFRPHRRRRRSRQGRQQGGGNPAAAGRARTRFRSQRRNRPRSGSPRSASR